MEPNRADLRVYVTPTLDLFDSTLRQLPKGSDSSVNSVREVLRRVRRAGVKALALAFSPHERLAAASADLGSVDNAPQPPQGHSMRALARHPTTMNPNKRRGAARCHARISARINPRQEKAKTARKGYEQKL